MNMALKSIWYLFSSMDIWSLINMGMTAYWNNWIHKNIYKNLEMTIKTNFRGNMWPAAKCWLLLCGRCPPDWGAGGVARPAATRPVAATLPRATGPSTGGGLLSTPPSPPAPPSTPPPAPPAPPPAPPFDGGRPLLEDRGHPGRAGGEIVFSCPPRVQTKVGGLGGNVFLFSQITFS